MPEPNTLLDESSPLGNVAAILEDDGRVVYLYLHFSGFPEGEGIRSCWVRNRIQAPDSLDVKSLREGIAPLMPRKHCVNPRASPALDASALRLVWFDEGNGVALLDGDEILAIVPPWSGEKGFHGYARDCQSEGPCAWPLTTDNVLQERIRRADEYWRSWDDSEFWPKFRDAMVESLEAVLGQHTKYYAIDGNNWPPKAMLRFDHADRYFLVTIGVSLLPQPEVESSTDDVASLRRIELGAAFDSKTPVEEVLTFGRYISGQSGYPWNHWTWFGEGHTLPCDSTPAHCGGKRFPAIVFSGRFPDTPTVAWPKFRGDPINLLWMVPITEAERQWAVTNRSSALIERLIENGVTGTMGRRRQLKFS